MLPGTGSVANGREQAASVGGGSRAGWPGSLSSIRAVVGLLAAGGLIVALAIVVLGGGSGSVRAHRLGPGESAGTLSGARVRTSGHTYGYIPAWLPQAKVPVRRVVTASAARPRLAIQGDTVRVLAGGASVLVTIAGPSVPEEGRFPVPKTSPCTFTATFTRATAPIALDARQFATIDEAGRLHVLKVSAVGGGPVPARLRAGQTLTLTLSGRLPTGEGRIMWAPVAGRGPFAQWDFDVEID